MPPVYSKWQVIISVYEVRHEVQSAHMTVSIY